MTAQTHQELGNFIWRICDLLRGPYKRNEYRKVILPMTVLRRFDCLLAPTKDAVLAKHEEVSRKPEAVVHSVLTQISGHAFYNTFKLDMKGLLGDPNHIARNLTGYIDDFSTNVREIMERFKFQQQIERMAEKNLLYEVVKSFAGLDLSPERVHNVQMGYVFEELIRIGAEQSNEEAGEHYTPREVIRLMVTLLLSEEEDLRKSHVVKTIYDPACGTSGMLAVAEQYIRHLNADARPILYGQELNDDAWAVARSDMLIKGADADNILRGDTLTNDGFQADESGEKWTFDYMLANPPFGVEWKQQRSHIKREAELQGHAGRFGAGLPRISDGSLLFLQHMLSKMRAPEDGGSRIAVVFNGSPLFTGGAGSGESNIRQWIIENDWLEAVVALPNQLFYNTGISTYVWVLTNRKDPRRRGKVQLLDARRFFVKMPKSLGNKRNKIGDPIDSTGEPDQIREITRIYGNFQDGEFARSKEEDPVTKKAVQRDRVVSRVFENEDFGFRQIVVERPLRLNFQASPERIERLGNVPAFAKLPEHRQEEICEWVQAFADRHGKTLYRDRGQFLADWHEVVKKADGKTRTIERKAVLEGLGDRDPEAEICRSYEGEPEPDPKLRESEIVPLREKVDDYLLREVLSHVPDAWVDHGKTKIGYEIPLTRHFYRYDPPRPLGEIDEDIKILEDEIVALVDKTRNLIERLQEKRRALITETMTRDLPPDENRKADLGPCHELKSSGVLWLGVVPEHWNVGRLKYWATINDEQLTDSTEPDFEIAYVDIGSIDSERGTVSEKNVRFERAPSRARRVVRPGDTIVSTVRTYLRAIATLHSPKDNTIVSTGFAVLRPRKLLLPSFLGYVARSTWFVDAICSRSVGVSYPATNASEIGNIAVMLPDLREQQAIASFLDVETTRIDQLVQHAQLLIERLREKRQALITAAVTGQIDVRDEGRGETE